MNTNELVKKEEQNLKKIFENIENTSFFNSKKVLNAFHKYQVSSSMFDGTTGYGYDDLGRDTIEKIYAEIFKAEDALVRREFISGTHALTVCLFGLLRPNDTMLSITGKPYDTLDQVIGLKENASSLKSFNINYEQIDLINNEFDVESIINALKSKKIKLIEIQRSKGYSTRKSITIEKLEQIIKEIRKIDKDVIIMVDNCYCEFVTEKEPIEVGADICVGSLIKNLGGGIAENGAYIVGKENLVKLCAERLTAPGEGKEIGPTLGSNKQFLKGLFLAPNIVESSLKTAVLTAKVLEKLGYDVEPKYNDSRADIVQNIIFNDKDKLIKYCQGIQNASPIDSHVLAIPSPMPGYDDEVIMASGSFTQGSSIELSCDGPLRSPYIAYQQGGLTYEYGKLGLINAIEFLNK